MASSKKAKLRGVNLGGWLLLERWMTPSLFEGLEAKDEYGFMQAPGALEKIEFHRGSFIAEKDFKWLSEHGINAVRLPIGYWVLEGREPYANAARWLDFAVDMCEKYGLKLLIDLHGAPGSQNGWHHSGRAGEIGWHKDRSNQLQSIETLEQLAKRYYDRSCVWGYQLLNEPRPGLIQRQLRRYYRQAYRRLISVARPGTSIVFHDGFTSLMMSGVIRPVGEFPVFIDRHWYHFMQIFRDRLPLSWYFRKLSLSKYYFRLIRWTQPLVIGEWSGVLAHSVASKMPDSKRRQAERRHIDQQIKLYDNETDGWFYWSYKTEKSDLWNFRSLVEKGIISID